MEDPSRKTVMILTKCCAPGAHTLVIDCDPVPVGGGEDPSARTGHYDVGCHISCRCASFFFLFNGDTLFCYQTIDPVLNRTSRYVCRIRNIIYRKKTIFEGIFPHYTQKFTTFFNYARHNNHK